MWAIKCNKRIVFYGCCLCIYGMQMSAVCMCKQKCLCVFVLSDTSRAQAISSVEIIVIFSFKSQKESFISQEGEMI